MSSEQLFPSDGGCRESCYKCGRSEGVNLITRDERVGCLITPFSYCNPCMDAIVSEEKEQRYKTENFCNRCDKKFSRPYFMSRKWLYSNHGFMSYGQYLCSPCYDEVRARAVEVNGGYQDKAIEVDEDFW